jgi:hypothetical protein
MTTRAKSRFAPASVVPTVCLLLFLAELFKVWRRSHVRLVMPGLVPGIHVLHRGRKKGTNQRNPPALVAIIRGV